MNGSIAMPNRTSHEQWLKTYYFARAGVSIAWVLAAVNAAPHSVAAAALLLAYPLWDAVANLVDCRRSGGLAANPTQALNVVVSLAVAVALAVTLNEMHRVLAVFGAWAILSGVLQLATGLRRWKAYGAQWTMILSGAQSALAGAVFIFQAGASAEPTVATVAGYAGFGAFYFLLSGVMLGIRARRAKTA